MSRRKDKAIYPLLAFANPVYSDMKEITPRMDRSQESPGNLPPSGESSEEPSMRARAYLNLMGGHFLELPETEDEARKVKAIMEAPDQIRQPALVLSNPDPETHQDGFLTMADVFQFTLNADLVTLSACNTGMGKVLRSEGIVGLTRAFMYAHPFFWASAIIFGEGS